MITVLREAGFRIMIHTDDHEPAHVHVRGDGDAKIALLPDVRVILSRGMTRAEARRAAQLVAENREFLLRRWEEIHG